MGASARPPRGCPDRRRPGGRAGCSCLPPLSAPRRAGSAGQAHDEAASLPLFRLHAHPAAVRLDQALDDGEAEPRAATPTVSLLIGIEDARELARGNSDARVPDEELD